jgi:hypothetical protein
VLSVAGLAESAPRGGRRGLLLRFATISVDEFGGGSTRQPNIRPILRGIARFKRGTDYAGRYELFETAPTAGLRRGSGRNELGYDPAMSGDGDALARLDSANIAAEIVFQIANAS